MTLRLLAALILCALAVPASARYDGPSDPWFATLRNSNGFPCCDGSDGHRIEDVDWRHNPDGTYSVRINGDWQPINPELIVKERNRKGYAVLWTFSGGMTCFMPGQEG